MPPFRSKNAMKSPSAGWQGDKIMSGKFRGNLRIRGVLLYRATIVNRNIWRSSLLGAIAMFNG
jgi:hypothetical protein